jgi:hypothetical protein
MRKAQYQKKTMINIHISSGLWHQISTTSNLVKELEFLSYKCHYFLGMPLIRKLGWNKVAAITQDGEKYIDYISTLQDTFQDSRLPLS